MCYLTLPLAPNSLPLLMPIYLDNNATTRPDDRALALALPFLTEIYANASSSHPMGARASDAVKLARQQVAALLHGEAHEIVFTSGATEALNLAIKGVAETAPAHRNHLITLTTEHPAVLDTFRAMEAKGFRVSYVPVLAGGEIDIEAFEAVLDTHTLLVAVMLANNETGVLQPIKQIAESAHSVGAYMLTDATQAVGKMPVDVQALGIDMLAFSGHKFHAPKGIGGLYVCGGTRLQAQLHGGGHERNLRSGTLNTFGIVAMGAACEVAQAALPTETMRIAALRDRLETALLTQLPRTERNGNALLRLPNTTNILFRDADSDVLQRALPEIMVANGSACSSAKIEPSHVLTAMGRSQTEAFQSLRFSLSRYTTENEIDATIAAVIAAVEKIRASM